MESDQTHLFNAAHLMVLAHVTCKPNASRLVGGITGINLQSTKDFTPEPKYCGGLHFRYATLKEKEALNGLVHESNQPKVIKFDHEHDFTQEFPLLLGGGDQLNIVTQQAFFCVGPEGGEYELTCEMMYEEQYIVQEE
ncbi:hypothetical protein DEO72_LG10g2244 [Vigna unguiculata]|uniref:Uncharacterized protein n=1 Tax=Vigna unguiculata TaxID=3917 RepID=A0A4D6NDR2_VIGUN|nr:hypothetical protein DEO72_LG10g2244 [Vigna unguiculata]